MASLSYGQHSKTAIRDELPVLVTWRVLLGSEHRLCGKNPMNNEQPVTTMC